MEDLFYGEKKMSREPINISFEDVVNILAVGDPVFINLQPGDATRYNIFITPCWNRKIKTHLKGIGIDEYNSYEYITFHYEIRHRASIVPIFCHPNDFIELSQNQWTQTFFSWFVNNIGEALRERYLFR